MGGRSDRPFSDGTRRRTDPVEPAREPVAHILRHTFCSHLAMRGAPARTIQELAGHQDLSTTQRYMHLSPAAVDGAIRLLERGREKYGRRSGPQMRRPEARSHTHALLAWILEELQA